MTFSLREAHTKHLMFGMTERMTGLTTVDGRNPAPVDR